MLMEPGMEVLVLSLVLVLAHTSGRLQHKPRYPWSLLANQPASQPASRSPLASFNVPLVQQLASLATNYPHRHKHPYG